MSTKDHIQYPNYNYYQDVYSVLSDIFSIELERVIDKYGTTGSRKEIPIWAAGFTMKNRRCIYHVYHSMQGEQLDLPGGSMDGCIHENMGYVACRSREMGHHFEALFSSLPL